MALIVHNEGFIIFQYQNSLGFLFAILCRNKNLSIKRSLLRINSLTILMLICTNVNMYTCTNIYYYVKIKIKKEFLWLQILQDYQ